MKPLWVQQFYNEWGFYPMAGGTLGDGSSWDETNPQQSTLANTLDSYDRDVRIGVRGRMALEHEWPSSQSVTSAAGYHKFITLQNQASKPTISGTQLAAIYTKTVGGGLQELFYENELGTEVQVSNRSVLNVNLPFSSSYTSAQLVVSQTAQNILTHSLGAIPKLVQLRLVCSSAEAGYSAADIAIIENNQSEPANNRGISTVIDVTSITLRYGNSTSVFDIMDKTTGNSTAITNAKWRLVVNAWA